MESVKAFPALTVTLTVVTALVTACSAAPGGTAVSSLTPGFYLKRVPAPAAC